MINIISRVSIFAVGVPVAAMVILLSVFNGFQGLVQSMYTSFDPDIVITPAKGKVFDKAGLDALNLRDVEGVGQVSYYLEESVLMEYRGRQTLGTLRGVDSLYEQVVPIRDLIVHGNYELRKGDMEQAVIGQGIQYQLGVRTALFNTLNIYIPRRGDFSSLLPVDAYTTGKLWPEGIFALDADTDGSYVLSTLEFAQGLFDYEGKVSGAAVRLAGGAGQEQMKKALQRMVGDDYKVLTRYEQKASMYRVMQYEKWAIFFISLLVLVIASFSIIGSLVMLIIDKKPDIRTLTTMGADVGFVRRIFVDEGMLIGGIGVLVGTVFGVLICWLQQQFGLVKLGGQSFLVDAYPVVMKWQDIAVVVVATLAVTWAISKLTVGRMLPKSSIRM